MLFDFDDFHDIIIFWAVIIGIFILIICQILYLKNASKMILFEIFITYILLHLVYQTGYYGLRGSDSYHDFIFLKSILRDQGFSLGKWVDGWPMIHVFSAIICLLTEIDPLMIAKYLPSFFSAFVVLPIYLLVLKIFDNKQVALLSCLIYGTIPQFMLFEGLFVRETFALFIMIFFFYIIYVYNRNGDFRYALLFIPLVPALMFSHHFTPFMFIILLIVYTVISKIVPYIYKKNTFMVKNLTGKISVEIIFLVLIVAVLAYWVYHTFYVVLKFYATFEEITGTQEYTSYSDQVNLGSPIITLRGNVIFYSFFIFNGLILLMLFLKTLIIKNIQKIEDLAFSGYLFFSFLYSFVATYVLGSLILPQRFFSFGWIFGVIPFAAIMGSLKKDMYKKLFGIFLAMFLIHNVYNIDPTYYTDDYTEKDALATEKEYIIAERINFSGGYYGYIGVNGPIYEIQGFMDRNNTDMYDFLKTSKMAIIKEGPFLQNLEGVKTKSYQDYVIIMETISYKNQENVDKLYDLGTIYIIKS
jgi:hypothetical protein